MTSAPGEKYRQYDALYHGFTEAYAHTHQLSREFYPIAKRFIHGIEPDINNYMKKLNGNQSVESPRSHQAFLQYMSHFDDFILRANNLFSDLKQALEESDDFMIRVLNIKIKTGERQTGEPVTSREQLLPELTKLLSS